MAKRIRYVCSHCGHKQTGWTGSCPECGEWGTMEEVVEDSRRERQEREAMLSSLSSGSSLGGMEEAERLTAITIKENQRLDTGFEEMNRVLGGGLVPDSLVMLTAPPGAGKSTLLLEVAENLAERGSTVLYASGEESPSQIKERAQRILPQISDRVYLLSTNSMDRLGAEVNRLHPAALIIDSLQTMSLAAFPQREGTPTQTVQVTAEAVRLCKDPAHPMAAFLVGHMTKADEMAGLRTLAHLVDAVLYLEKGGEDQLRMLRSSKNRFGYTGEVGLFQMEEGGLVEVKDPYDLFLTQREEAVPGCAISLQREGSRMIPIEIEALTSPSYEAYPSRIGDSLRRDELNTLISVLEEKAGYGALQGQNVVLKATGGLAIREKVCDLAVTMAIASAFDHFPLSGQTAFLGEVGLTGELKRVDGMGQRLKELKRLGFRRVYIPLASKRLDEKGINGKNFRDIPCRDLLSVIQAVKGEEG